MDNIRIAVQEKNVTVEDLKSFLLSLPVFTRKDEKLTLLSDAGPELMELPTVTAIFNFLKTEHASFLDYEIFKVICSHYSVGRNLNYSDLFREYCKKHKVAELANHISQLNSKGCMEQITFKFDLSSTCTLAKVGDLKESIASALELYPSALHIVDIHGGCVIITFFTPPSVAEAIFTPDKAFTAEQKAKFRAASALWLKYKGIIIPFGKEESEVQGMESAS